MASWSTAPAEAPTLPRPRRAPARAKAVPRAKAAPRPRAFGGVVWIVVLGVLLAGVVAVNVGVLQLNIRLDSLGRERVQLRFDNARLRSQLSSAGAAARIESQARNRLGLVPADPDTTEYVRLPTR
jgi:cell division protein FtsL